MGRVKTKFSESPLWQLQKAAYEQFGPDAWANKGVPFYLTSNPLIAKQFADVIADYVGDKPATIFDLGAGSGRLAYLVLKHLNRPSVDYVMTDISDQNISFWEKHLYFKEFQDQLHFVKYHHDQPIDFDIVEGPVILICTYLFDTIPQDLFKVESGQLLEGHIVLDLPSDEMDPALIMDLKWHYEYEPVDSENYYENPVWNQLLKEYKETFEGVPFLFPTGSLQVIDTFAKLSNNKLLILAGDQGVATEAQVQNWGEPKISKHASFSVAVSYHALKRYLEILGGGAFLPKEPNTKFVVMNGWLGITPSTTTTDQLQPVEYLEMTDLSDEQLKSMPLEEIFSLIEKGNYDPINFHVFYHTIREKIHTVSPKVAKVVIEKVYDQFYPVNPEEGDFILNLGVLLYDIKEYALALKYYHHALQIKGKASPLIFYNIAECYRAMKAAN